ncbi:redoxin domain-containing protein [Anaeromicropila populeti]|uniref:AhpC/TSA family protein n=1 Tax=Anaeromicropila populeti TaxID=37658 RepID=A0A1I6HQE2_9FIRM|nr:redoxin domain-containing protein [Anaeromicropila populeti]SFR56673.1 AhpC/TSA family protein [Anaeromicropila populeti]
MLNCLSLGMTAPEFTYNTTFGPVSMSDYKGKWLIFFSHPGDFTPVTID